MTREYFNGYLECLDDLLWLFDENPLVRDGIEKKRRRFVERNFPYLT